ncbi:hypothetical protein [Microbacterium sp. HJ5]
MMEHEIAPMTRICIDAVAARLGVAPTAVREALDRLEADGLAQKPTIRGYTTSALLSAEEVDQLFQMRTLLEPLAAAEAARSRSRKLTDALEAEVDPRRISFRLGPARGDHALQSQ